MVILENKDERAGANLKTRGRNAVVTESSVNLTDAASSKKAKTCRDTTRRADRAIGKQAARSTTVKAPTGRDTTIDKGQGRETDEMKNVSGKNAGKGNGKRRRGPNTIKRKPEAVAVESRAAARTTGDGYGWPEISKRIHYEYSFSAKVDGRGDALDSRSGEDTRSRPPSEQPLPETSMYADSRDGDFDSVDSYVFRQPADNRNLNDVQKWLLMQSRIVLDERFEYETTNRRQNGRRSVTSRENASERNASVGAPLAIPPTAHSKSCGKPKMTQASVRKPHAKTAKIVVQESCGNRERTPKVVSPTIKNRKPFDLSTVMPMLPKIYRTSKKTEDEKPMTLKEQRVFLNERREFTKKRIIHVYDDKNARSPVVAAKVTGTKSTPYINREANRKEIARVNRIVIQKLLNVKSAISTFR